MKLPLESEFELAKDRKKKDVGKSDAPSNKNQTHKNSADGASQPKKTRIGFIIIAVAVVIVIIGFLGKGSLRSYCITLAKDRLSKFEYTQAIEALEFTEDWQVDNDEVHFLKARIYRKLGKFDEFEKSLAQSRTLGLDESKAEYEKLLLGGQSGRIAELLNKLEELVGGVHQFDPAEVYEALVNGFLLHGRVVEATEYVENWKKDYPEDPSQKFYEAVMLIRYGPIQRIEGAQEKAASILEKLVSAYPSYFRARMTYGDLLFELNQVEKSAEQFENCIKNPDAGMQPKLSLARCYANLGRTEDAKKMFEQVLEETPDNNLALSELGKLQLADEEFDLALKNLQAAFPSRRWDMDLNNDLGQALQANGRAEDAKPYFDRAEVIREKRGEIQQLMEELDQGFRDEEKRFELGKLLLEYGNPEHGVLYLRSVLDVNPRHRGAFQALQNHFATQQKTNPRLNFREASPQSQNLN